MDEIKRIRKAMGLRQEDIAALLGVTQATVSRWEAGKFAPTAEAMSALRALAEQPA